MTILVAIGLVTCSGCQDTTGSVNKPAPKQPKPSAAAASVQAQAAEAKQGAVAVAIPLESRKLKAESGDAPSDDLGAPSPRPSPKGRGSEETPLVDEGKIAVAGIRKLTGVHIVVYTDLAAAAEALELPQVFDAAVPLWCDYFGVDPERVADWKVVGCVMQDQERFVGAGLYPEDLPQFPNGYARGPRQWIYDQPSGYYRRHLLLHEGTHQFMRRFLGGTGPPWYMEGMAELLGTHRWQEGKLTLAVMPRSKEEVPYWGRVRAVKEERAAGRGLTLSQIMQFDAQAHLRNEAYAWSWAAAAFLDQHPLTQAPFRELKQDTRDSSSAFSKRFAERLAEHWSEINEEWQLFVAECDYGYDFARAAVVRRPSVPLPSGGASVTVATDHGWQSSGYRLEAGKTYAISAAGRYQIAAETKPWPCEAGGVTIRYAGGRPLGMLLAAVSDVEEEADGGPTKAESGKPKAEGGPALADQRFALVPGAGPTLLNPEAVGASGELQAAASGTLYFKINEPASGLADNVGTLEVRVSAK